MKSVPPPRGNGTISLIGLAGQSARGGRRDKAQQRGRGHDANHRLFMVCSSLRVVDFGQRAVAAAIASPFPACSRRRRDRASGVFLRR